MNINPWIAAPIAIGVGLPLWIGFVLWLVSKFSGWSALAKEYGTDDPAPPSRLYMQSASLRFGSNYGNCLTLAVDHEAVYARPVWPFGFGHRMLKLPWSEAQVTQAIHMFGIRSTTFTFERVPTVPFRLSQKTAERLVEMAKRNSATR